MKRAKIKIKTQKWYDGYQRVMAAFNIVTQGLGDHPLLPRQPPFIWDEQLKKM